MLTMTDDGCCPDTGTAKHGHAATNRFQASSASAGITVSAPLSSLGARLEPSPRQYSQCAAVLEKVPYEGS